MFGIVVIKIETTFDFVFSGHGKVNTNLKEKYTKLGLLTQ